MVEQEIENNQTEADKTQVDSRTQLTEAQVLLHPSYQGLLAKLKQTEETVQTNRHGWLSAQAELENIKRRCDREIASAHKYGIEKFALEILETVDNLERSLTIRSNQSENNELNSFYAGIELTLKSLLETLQRFEVNIIDPINESFDHEKHTAINTRELAETAPGTVVEVIQKGYFIKDRLLRPALVVVAK